MQKTAIWPSYLPYMQIAYMRISVHASCSIEENVDVLSEIFHKQERLNLSSSVHVCTSFHCQCEWVLCTSVQNLAIK